MSEVTPRNRPSPGLPEPRSVPVPGEPGARMNAKVEKLVQYHSEDVRTLYDVMLNGAKLSNNGKCLGTRKGDGYEWINYDQVIEGARQIGAGLIHIGAEAGQNSKIGIYSQNRAEYILAELGCYTYSMILVPLYDTLGEEAVNYIVEHTEIEYVVVDTPQKIPVLLRQEASKNLKVIVCMVDVPQEVHDEVQGKNIRLLTFAELRKLGQENEQPVKPPAPDDLNVICYTSGTTGMPKGVMSTHANYISVISSMRPVYKFKCDDVYLSYLPLAHCYERFAVNNILEAGGQVAFFGGDVKGLLADMQAAKPTIFCAVPRLLNRIYDKVNAGVQNGGFIKKALYNYAYNQKVKALNKGVLNYNTIWDKLVFKKVRALMGGRCRMVTTGAAPLSLAVMDFSRIAFGCSVVEGFGQTENSAYATCQLPGELRAGNVGPPSACCYVKLVDIPEMDYFSSNNQGEVCVKGGNVFKGYYKNPEKTAEALDEDGWLHTGDIGQWTEDWSLKIIDRKKHIFKLSQGEYLAPERIENFYIRSAAVGQMFVYGNSLKDCLVGIAFADPENIQSWAKSKVGASGDLEEVCKNPKVVKAILDDLTAIGKEAGLKTFEQVKAIYVHHEPMTPENNLTTPTFKAKRPQIQRRFQQQLDDMYARL